MSDLLGVIQNLGRRILAVEQALPSTPRWAEVTQVTPLRVRLDGDLSALEVTPENLAGALELGQRVLVHIYGRRAVVYGPVTVSGGDVYQVGEPVGSIHFTLALTTDPAPSGCLWLEGGTVSRTTYPELFALWGTRFGVGDGSTTFGLRDMRGLVPVAWKGSGVFNQTPGTAVGAETVTLTANQSGLRSHSHTAGRRTTGAGSTTSGTGVPPHNSTPASATEFDAVITSTTAASDALEAHSNVQPSLVGRYYVRAASVTLAPAGSTAAIPATPNTVAQRDSGGRTQVATPVAASDAANKIYVDTKFPRVRVPSSIVVTGGGTATVDADGTINFTNVSTLALNGIFDGVGMDTYEVTVFGTTSTGSFVHYRLRANGVDTAAGYNRVVVQTSLSAGPNRGSAAGVVDTCAMIPVNSAVASFNGKTTFQNPGKAVLTVMQHKAWSSVGSERYLWDEVGDGGANSHDGLSLRASAGTMTGSITVRKVA